MSGNTWKKAKSQWYKKQRAQAADLRGDAQREKNWGTFLTDERNVKLLGPWFDKLIAKQKRGEANNPLREKDIIYDAPGGVFFVVKQTKPKKAYTVFKNVGTHAVSVQSFKLNSEGLSLAKTYANYKSGHPKTMANPRRSRSKRRSSRRTRVCRRTFRRRKSCLYRRTR